MPLKIGIVVDVNTGGATPPKFIQAVNSRNAGLSAEYAQLGGKVMDELREYAKIGRPHRRSPVPSSLI